MVINVNGQEIKLKKGMHIISIKEKYFEIFNKNNNTIYFEDLDGNWELSKYDNYNGNEEIIYRKDSDGYVEEWIRNKEGKITYCQDSYGNWYKYRYDDNGKANYYESSTSGIMFDKRNKKVELTLDEIAKKFKVDVKNLKIVK